MSTSIIINIEGYNYGVDVHLTQLAQDIASAFLQSHKIDSEYHSAVELEILRSQVKLSSSLSEAHSHECVLRKKEKIVRCAEERARLADLQVSKLSKSLRNVELMLPVLLHATQGQDKGDVEGKDPDSRSCGYDLHDELETALRSLMHHYGFVVPERDEGSMTMQEWEKQDHEENCLLHSSSSRSGSPGKIEDSLSKGILFRQTHRSKRSISRLRSSSSEEYDQLSRLRSCSDNNITPAYSWKARYLELLKKFSAVVEERNVAQAEATAAVEEAKRLKACTMTDELILENERLREQTVKLRGEILKLRENIVEVKAAAAQALRTMGALGKEMATSGLLFENEAAELGATSPLSSTLYSTFATPSVSADTHNSGLNHIAAVVGEKRPAPLISPSRLPVRNSSPPKGIFRGHATPPSTSISVSGSAMHSHSGLAAPSEEPYVHIDMLRRDTPPGYEPDCAALPTSSSSSSTPTMPPHETQHSEAASSSSAYAHRHPADGTASPEQDLPPVEDVLELALRSAQVPIVGDRLLRLIFDRYNSQDGRFLMNSFRYLRCLKDCGVTINEEEVVSSGTRWLSYGVVSIVFNDSLKYRPEEHAPVLSAINSHVRNTSTVLTLKGAADPRATSLTHAQFVHAMKMLSLRLYADVIESEFGAAIEFLREPVKSTAAHQALELLLQDKLVPFAVLQGTLRVSDCFVILLICKP